MSIIKTGATNYEKLKSKVQSMIEEGRAQAYKAVSEIAVRTHFEIGKLLSEQPGIDQEKNAERLMAELASDIGVDRSVLYRSLKFFRSYPDGLPATPEFKRLGWGSHVELLPLTDDDERLFYVNRAADQRWGRNALRKAIKADLFGQERGADEPGPGEEMERPEPGMYTYEAIVERVVDGDTLLVRLDLGFDVLKRERIRLRGIDAAALNTPEGEKAKRFVEKTFKANPNVVLRTYWHDKYGRYVAEVFVKGDSVKKEDAIEKGLFLNWELVKNGLAKRVY